MLNTLDNGCSVSLPLVYAVAGIACVVVRREYKALNEEP